LRLANSAVIFVFLFCFVEEEEQQQQQNDLQNLQSHTPYPFLCPEFWQHYNYLKEFHDWHCTGSASVIDQQQYHQQQQFTIQQPVQTDVGSAVDTIAAAAAYAGHVLNTIAEEEAVDDENVCSPYGNDTDSSECEVTVTVTLPLKKAAAETIAGGAVQEQATASSPVDFWQQINDGAGAQAVSAVSAVLTSDNDDECSLLQKPSGVVCEPENLLQKQSDNACPPNDEVVSDCRQPSDREDDDADSGITTTSSAEMATRPTSDKDVVGSGRSRVVAVSSKKYQRTCTHSRLFDFLQRDDDDDTDDDDGADSSNGTDLRNKPPQSCTSGYSSAATTPSTPSAVGRSRTYESDLARTEYDSYYKSWEYACPYFGYDILPSKAFKTIATRLQGGGGPVAACKSPTTATAAGTTTRFKCPKIPTSEDGS